jgi:hypothetical protein
MTLQERWNGHVKGAKFGIGWEFPKAIREHGVENFVGRVLCECDTAEELSAMEDHWMKELNTLWPNGYNMRDGTNFVCEQTRKLISERTKAAMSDPELRTRLSDKAKARPIRTETIDAMACANRGKKRSAETRKAIRDALARNGFSDERRKRLSEALLGKPKSAEHRRKLSQALKGRPISEAARAARKKTNERIHD